MSLHRRQIVLFSALVTLHSVVWATPCYWRDGSIATFGGNNYTPCSSSSVSTCCLLAEGDTCTANGLCESSSGYLFRNACTDSTWTSPDCLPLCPGEQKMESHMCTLRLMICRYCTIRAIDTVFRWQLLLR